MTSRVTGEAAGKVWQWLGSLQERTLLALRFWTGEAVPRKAGPMVALDGVTGSKAPSCQVCNDAGHLIDPNG